MLISQSYFIDSCDDVELNIKRESKLEYRITYDDEKEIGAIVCMISGLGNDINDDLYISDYCARNFNIAVCNVNYHCIGNRPQIGASFYIDDIDKLILEASLKAIDLNLPIDLQKLNNYEEFYNIVDIVNKLIEKLKKEQIFDDNYNLYLSMGLQPTKNEYQNFGIMQAQDIINAILHIKSNPPFKIMGGGMPIILIGASHGGYLANLCAKISPWNVDFIIDNSSHTTLNDLWRMIGFGKEIDYIKYSCVGIADMFKNVKLAVCDKTHWTSNSSSPNYFSPARKLIREILNEDHLKVQSHYPKPKYIFYHSKFDQYVPLNEKEEFVNILKDLEFDVEFYKCLSEKDIDNKFIKNLTHGMGIPMKLLIKKHLAQILNEEIKNKNCKKEISYKSDDLIYTFKEENDKIKLYIH